jgi:hypothetical protein
MSTGTKASAGAPQAHIETVNPLESVEERVRHRAYQLYEARGREDGKDLEDWLCAESEINAALARATAA